MKLPELWVSWFSAVWLLKKVRYTLVIPAGGKSSANGALGFDLVFFAIWWAWMGFTCLVSAFDVHDVPYRIAVGVPDAFENDNFTTIVDGYVLMRIGSVTQWLRAAVHNPALGKTCFRYALGISQVQLGWLANLLSPLGWGVSAFLLLALFDMAEPLWAERSGATP